MWEELVSSPDLFSSSQGPMPGIEHAADRKEDVGGGGASVPQRLRVLVTGATGLLGRAVYKEFHQNSDQWLALGTGYRRARPRFLRCDLLDEAAVKAAVRDFLPDVIVHCAAERRPDVVERHTEAAIDLNVNATRTLAKAAAKTPGTFLIYISTDYVFDGRDPPYGEDDAPEPLNAYGRSKLEGEREALRHCPGAAAVLRVPVLYGEVERVAESAVTALWDRVLPQEGAAESHCTALDHRQQRFPTEVRDVATVVRTLAERQRRDPASVRGIFHYSAKERMTKYEMAVAIARAFRLPADHLVPLTGEEGEEGAGGGGARRPLNTQLACSRLERLGLALEPRSFSAAVADCLWPFLPDKRWRQTVFI